MAGLVSGGQVRPSWPWDGPGARDPWRREVADEMRDFCDRNRQAAVVALMSFAHAEDVQAVKACGATAVVAKLTPQTDLLEAIHAAISQSPLIQSREATR